MERARKSTEDASARLRDLTHDLSNTLETVMQACYLLGQSRLDANGKKWQQMIENAVQEAIRINRDIREAVRPVNEKPAARRRAS
jgi:uncharacterized protein YukE